MRNKKMSTLLFLGIFAFGYCACCLMIKSLARKDPARRGGRACRRARLEAFAGWACAVVWMIAYLIKPVIIIAG